MTPAHDTPRRPDAALSPRASRSLAQAHRLATLSSIVAIGSAITSLVAAFVITMRLGGVLAAFVMVGLVGQWAVHRAVAAGCLLAAMRPLGSGTPGAARARLGPSIEWLRRHMGERLLVAIFLPDVARVGLLFVVGVLFIHGVARLFD